MKVISPENNSKMIVRGAGKCYGKDCTPGKWCSLHPTQNETFSDLYATRRRPHVPWGTEIHRYFTEFPYTQMHNQIPRYPSCSIFSTHTQASFPLPPSPLAKPATPSFLTANTAKIRPFSAKSTLSILPLLFHIDVYIRIYL